MRQDKRDTSHFITGASKSEVNQAIANAVPNKRIVPPLEVYRHSAADNEKQGGLLKSTSKAIDDPAGTTVDKYLFRDLFGTSSPATGMSTNSTPSKPPYIMDKIESVKGMLYEPSDPEDKTESVKEKSDEPSDPEDKTKSVKEKSDELSDSVEKTKSVKEKLDEPQRMSSTAENIVGQEDRTATVEPPTQSGHKDENTTTDQPNTNNQEPRNTAVLSLDEAITNSDSCEAVPNHKVTEQENATELDPFELLNKKMEIFDAQYATQTAVEPETPVAVNEQGEVNDTIVVNPDLFSPQKRRSTSQPPNERKAKIQRSDYVVPEATMTTFSSVKSVSSPPIAIDESPTEQTKHTQESALVADTIDETRSVNRLGGIVGSVNTLIQTTKNEALKTELRFILSYTTRHLEMDVDASLKKYGVPIKKGKKHGL
jgi:hypothetical protein